MQGIEPHILDVSSEDAAANARADEKEIIAHVLMRPGPFTTPRAVYKTIRYSMRSKAQQNFQRLIKENQENGIGCYLELSSTESVYYKPLPVEENKLTVEPLLGKAFGQNTVMHSRKRSQKSSFQGRNMPGYCQNRQMWTSFMSMVSRPDIELITTKKQPCEFFHH